MDVVGNSLELFLAAHHMVEAFALPERAGSLEGQIGAMGGERLQTVQSTDQWNPRSQQ